MPTYFIEFKCIGGKIPVAVNSIMNKLHGYMRKYEVMLGIGFQEYTINSLGSRVRVFGTRDELNALLDNGGIKEAVSKSIFSLSVYTPTLVDVANARKVRFIAARSQNENIDAAFARKQRRYERRSGIKMSDEDVRDVKIHLLNKIKCLPYFTRKNNGKTYPIYVEKVAVDEGLDQIFNSHGLGNGGGYVYHE